MTAPHSDKHRVISDGNPEYHSFSPTKYPHAVAPRLVLGMGVGHKTPRYEVSRIPWWLRG